MEIARMNIRNFRGIKNGELFFNGHTVLIGDNNSGKSTVIEAIDLVLGPDRLSRRPVIDEHDFYAGEYQIADGTLTEIQIEVLIIDLSEEQKSRFRDHLEFWDFENEVLINYPPAKNTENESVCEALRVGFVGKYDPEEDDFIGKTFFLSPLKDNGEYDTFQTSHKRQCGFLFLRTLRTGSRALSLERGSLLDNILKLQEKRLQMWEDVLTQLKDVSVAEKKELGITDTLSQVQEVLDTLVPNEWANNPHIKVSDLTRETLRRTLTVFMDTGVTTSDGKIYSAPFQHQGTGTINTLVLALLSMIAELKKNVIFAMEEPEIAIPPHTQKRIIESILGNSAQAIFTSHSPYILEEFAPEQLIVLQRNSGKLVGNPCRLPKSIKQKTYKEEMRRRFCESLLARRVLIAEGRTEYDAWLAAAKKLCTLKPEKYKSLSNLGISVINAETDSQVSVLGKFFRTLGKEVFAVFDNQSNEDRAKIQATGITSFESPEKGFENLILKHSKDDSLKRFAQSLTNEWPDHLKAHKPTQNSSIDEVKDSLNQYFKWGKGSGTAAAFLSQCENCSEIPVFIRDALVTMKKKIGNTDQVQCFCAGQQETGVSNG